MVIIIYDVCGLVVVGVGFGLGFGVLGRSQADMNVLNKMRKIAM